MDFDNIGKQCAFCKQRDFLPFQCDRCRLFYCLDHRTPDNHQCPVNHPVISQKPSRNLPSYHCSVKDCRTKQSFQNICTRCGEHHCLRHRYPEEHNCSVIRHRSVINSTKVTKATKKINKKSGRKRGVCPTRISKLWNKISVQKN
jgi:AN1-type zinc finger protein 1